MTGEMAAPRGSRVLLPAPLFHFTSPPSPQHPQSPKGIGKLYKEERGVKEIPLCCNPLGTWGRRVFQWVVVGGGGSCPAYLNKLNRRPRGAR
jgi:hypothetical protein